MPPQPVMAFEDRYPAEGEEESGGRAPRQTSRQPSLDGAPTSSFFLLPIGLNRFRCSTHLCPICVNLWQTRSAVV
jgi:hypothetical protein